MHASLSLFIPYTLGTNLFHCSSIRNISFPTTYGKWSIYYSYTYSFHDIKMQQMSNMWWPTKKALMGVVQWQTIMSLLEKLELIFPQAQKLIDENKPYYLLYAMCSFSHTMYDFSSTTYVVSCTMVDFSSTKWHHSSATLYCPFGNYPST